MKHEFPEIGPEIGATPVLKKLVAAGHKLILFTMRSNNGDLPLITPKGIEQTSGNFLDDAVNWFAERDIPLYGINENPSQKQWTKSPKAYAELYIDDAALGCPLRIDYSLTGNGPTKQIGKPYVDWEEVEKMLLKQGIIEQ